MPPKVIGPKRALSIELLLFFAYCFFSASWMVGSIVTTDMAQEFGVYTIPSSVNNAISAAKILGNFVAAWILLKLGPKRTVSLSCLLICAVVVGAFSTSFPAFILTRFLLGFGGAILMICMTPYVVYCFEPKQQPIFIGLNNAGPNTGNLIALLSVTAVRGWLGSWRSVILFYGIFSVVFLVLWLFVGRGYPIAEKAKEETLSSTVYRYRDGLREPFLYKFLFTMTGRLVMYTVMLYLFPLHPDFTVDAQFISLMIALTGIPGTILGIVLAKKLKRQITLFRFSGVAQSILFFRHDSHQFRRSGHRMRHFAGLCDLYFHPLSVHPARPPARRYPAKGRRDPHPLLDRRVHFTDDYLCHCGPPGQHRQLDCGHDVHRAVFPHLFGGHLPSA